MKGQRKTFFSGMVALVLGTSCCWMSSLAIWVGGASFMGLAAHHMEQMRIPLLVIGIILISIAFHKKLKAKNK